MPQMRLPGRGIRMTNILAISLVGIFSAAVAAAGLTNDRAFAEPGDDRSAGWEAFGALGEQARIITEWSTTGDAAHPLIGRIWSEHEQALVEPAHLQSSLLGSDITIVGEAHDNPDHRRVQAFALRAILFDGGKTAVVMEMLSTDQNPALATLAALMEDPSRTLNAAAVKDALSWQTGPWSKYDYDAILEEIGRERLPLLAGDPSRATIREVAKTGLSALPEGEHARLKLDVPLGMQLEQASLSEIEAAHCGMLPASAMPSMALAQRFRDAHLADATLGAAKTHGRAVLVTGNTHARSDRGVSWYIRHRAPETAVLTVMAIEVEEGNVTPESYVPRDPDGKSAADYVIFTPRPERGDPCDAFRPSGG